MSGSERAGGVECGGIAEVSSVVPGGFNVSGGTLTFTLTAPDHTVVDTEIRPVTGDGTYMTANTHVATQVGTYTWTVHYSGDGLNNGTIDQGGAAEQQKIGRASRREGAKVSEAAGAVKDSAIVQDSAGLSGGLNVRGSTLTVTLTAPDHAVVDREIDPVTGDGTYTTANTHVATQVGTYTWTVQYSGNGLNNATIDQGGAAEQQ